MKLGVAKERFSGEKRVAVIPETVQKLTAKGFSILIEKDAGLAAGYTNEAYEKAGANLVASFKEIADSCEVLLKVRYPDDDGQGGNEAEKMKDGAIIFCMHEPLTQDKNIEIFKKKKQMAFSMDFIPRITLAQSMDVLSSNATIAGYKAVLLAANEIGRFYPMLMTAAGTMPPAKVLILGAGVAGLQAIATAKRLGGVVEAFDTRPEVKEQVMSLGAKFLEIDHVEDVSDDQGYAKEASEEFLKKEKALLKEHLAKSDVCITTAQVFGRKAPVLIHQDMIEGMKPGSVIVDLAVEQGGNCELSKVGEVVNHKGVFIIGPDNIASQMADHASRMYSKNIENLLNHLAKEEEGKVSLDMNPEDEIVSRSLVTRDGEMVSEIVKKFKK